MITTKDANFYKKAHSLCKSIISQRLLLIKSNKSKLVNIDLIRAKTEDLEIEFNKYNSCCTSLSYYIENNYMNLFSIIPCTQGIATKRSRLHELYKQSLLINKTI